MINDLDIEKLKTTFENATEDSDANLLWEGDDVDIDVHHHNDDGGLDDNNDPQ